MVSVIIPNYNHAIYLTQRIESVLNQTNPDFEVIILDDCSTDNSRDIIEQYRNHPKVSKIVYNETNSGSTFKQWQKGIELAQGEWIWMAESDDYSEPTFVENLMIDLNRTDSDIAFCQSMAFSENEILFISSSISICSEYSGDDFIKNRLILNNSLFNASMILFKKSLINKIDFNKIIQFKYCGDWLFWIQILPNSKICESGKILNYFRKHGGDVTTVSLRNGIAILEFKDIQLYLFKNGFINSFEYQRNLYNQLHQSKQNLPNTIENKFAIDAISKEITTGNKIIIFINKEFNSLGIHTRILKKVIRWIFQ